MDYYSNDGCIGSWINNIHSSKDKHQPTNPRSWDDTTSFETRTLELDLPPNYNGIETDSDRRITLLRDTNNGCIQVGDYIRKISDGRRGGMRVSIKYTVLVVESRPNTPFQLQIGNPDKTPLGIALGDSVNPKGVTISNIRIGSLGERCGFLRIGDRILSVVDEMNNGSEVELINSEHGSQIIRKLIETQQIIKLNIQPLGGENASDDKEIIPQLLSFCLWKDSSFDDWGFSLIDSVNSSSSSNTSPTVHEIRGGGPAFLTGLKAGDQLIAVNGRDVSNYETRILVPILASLDEALNLIILRYNS